MKNVRNIIFIKNCSNSRGTGKGNNKNAGNIFQCSGELNGTRSGTERRWKKRCSGALSIISVTLSKAFRSAPLELCHQFSGGFVRSQCQIVSPSMICLSSVCVANCF